jgi:hypothetical protein
MCQRNVAARLICSDKPPPSADNEGVRKMPSAKSFASRWKRRSLNPTARLVGMLPPEQTAQEIESTNIEPTSKPTDNANQEELIDTSKLKPSRRKLSPEERLNKLIENNDDAERK